MSNALRHLFEQIFQTRFPKEAFLAYITSIKWFTISRFFTMFFSLITTIIVARFLGPDSFGVLNYVLSIVGIFSIIATLGLGNIVYRELVANKDRREEILGSALTLNFITGFIGIFLISIFLYYYTGSTEIKTLIFLLSLSFLTQPFLLLSFDLLKDRDSKYVSIAQIVYLFISNVSKIVVVYFGLSLAYFMIILVVENIVAGLIYAYQIKYIKGRSLHFSPSRREIFYILSFAVPLILFATFTEIYARISQIMLNHMIDIKAVGLYASAVRLTEIWYFIPNILISALFPAFVSVQDEPKEYAKRNKYLLLTLITIALIISILTFTFRDLLVSIVYGAEFIAASPLLAVYIFSIFGSFMAFLLYQDLFLENKTWMLVVVAFITAAINVALNLYLIPIRGALGAAIAAVVSINIVPTLFYIYRSTKKYHIEIKP